MHYLGIDLGTSGIKVVVCDAESRVLHSQSAGLTVQNPAPLWSEQSPNSWWEALCTCMDALAQSNALENVSALGIAGQMHGAVLLDGNNNVLRPAILWNDGRCEAECEYLMTKVPDAKAITGNLVMPGFTAPKLQWVRHNEPEIFAKTKKVLLPKDYLRFLITGDFASEMSDAAGTSWLNTAKRAWSDEMLSACGLDQSHMPALFEGTQVTGTLNGDLAARWKMKPVPVVGGGGDNAAGAVGVGIVENGQAMISLGTSGVIFSVTNEYRANPEAALHSFCHAIDNNWHVMSVHLSAASCLQWYADIAANGDVPTLLAEMEDFEPEPSNCYFLPFLSGERTPHNNPKLTGQFIGLTHATNRASMTYAILEGVSFAFKEGLKVIHDADIALKTLSVIGGGARSPYWRELLCNALDVTLEYREGGEVGPALGAARLAMVGAIEDAALDTLCPAPPIVASHTPSKERSQWLSTRFDSYVKLTQNALQLTAL